MENNIKALIVDDDDAARNILQKFLEIGDKVEVVASLNSTEQALSVITEMQPDVLFLDINMPVENGLHFAHRLKNNGHKLPIVFTSAYKNYAASAFNLRPIDFLVKPFGLDVVFDVLTKVEEYLKEQKQLEHTKSKIFIPKKLKLKTPTGYIFINPQDILYVQVNRDRTELVSTNDECFRVMTLLKEIYSELQKFNFFQINRSVVVNTRFVENVDKVNKSCLLKCKEKSFPFKVSASNFKDFENLRSLNLG